MRLAGTIFSTVLFAGLILPNSLSQATHITAASLPVRGVVRAVNVAAISTDLAVPIKKLPFREGQSFKKGQTLVEFDCARFAAARSALVSERKIHFLTYSNNLTLLKHKAIGQFDVQVSKAKVGKADAEIEQLDVRLARCVVKAPFNGVVEETYVRQYETPKSGVPFVRIIESGALEIDLIVPSKWLAWLKVGEQFSFKVDETGKTYQGIVTRLGASVDPVSQTIELKGSFSDKDASVFAGMSGSAKFKQAGS